MRLRCVERCGIDIQDEVKIKQTEASHPTFRDIYFLGIRKVTYREINQAVFGSKFIRYVKLGDEGQSMSDLDFKRRVGLFVCFMHHHFAKLRLQRVLGI